MTRPRRQRRVVRPSVEPRVRGPNSRRVTTRILALDRGAAGVPPSGEARTMSDAGQADVLGHRWRRGDAAVNLRAQYGSSGTSPGSLHHFLPYLRRPAIARSVHAPGSPCDRLEAANAEHLQASLSRNAASPSSKRTRLASTLGDSERSSGGRSSVRRRAGRLEVELRRM